MKKTIKILTLILLLSSCVSDRKEVEEKIDDTSREQEELEKLLEEFDRVQLFRSVSKSTASNGTQKIQFSDLTILVDEIEMGWDSMYRTGNDSVCKVDTDTAYFYLFPGDWFFDKKFTIQESGFDEIELYEKISYNMTMTSNRGIEVPLSVLNNWKTFESEWSRIQLDNNELKFMSNEDNVHPVINFTLEEYKAAVKEYLGIEWYNEIKNIKSKDKLPTYIFATFYTFKIVARNSKTGKVITKFIVFESPTSC